MNQFAKISTIAIKNLDSFGELAVYTKLVALSFRWGYSNISQTELANQFNVSPRTVRRTLKSLEEKGWLWVIRKPNCSSKYFPRDENGKPVCRIRREEVKFQLQIKYGVHISFEPDTSADK